MYPAAHKHLIDYMVAHGYSVRISAHGCACPLIELSNDAIKGRTQENDLYDACREAVNVQILFAKDGRQHWALVSIYDLAPEETVMDFGDAEIMNQWFNEYMDGVMDAMRGEQR